MRALVPHGSTMAARGAESGEPLRSEDDTALMRSLIGLMPHERADSQFSVTSPVRRSGASAAAVRHESWFGSHRPDRSAFGGGAAGSTGADPSGSRYGDDSDNRGGAAGGAGGGSSRGGLDFLGTTDSVRNLFHLPYTSDAVTVGLHRVGQTLVLDGNLDDVLAPAAAAATAKPPVPAPPPPSSSRASKANGGARASGSNTVVGGGEKEGRWVMVGRGGKPQQREDAEDEEGQPWGVGNDEYDRYSDSRSSVMPPGNRADSGQGRRQKLPSASLDTASQQALGEREWSVNQGSWPALGAPVANTTATASPSGENAALLAPTIPDGSGILSIVPSRPRSQSFGVRPPEPAGFWRSFQWELAGMHLMLGSSLPVCSTSEHPQVSVRLHDGDEDLSLCTCLDYYLDNIMESVPELALCMREKGFIQGCRVVCTEDIPYLGSLLRKVTAAQDSELAAASGAGPQSEAGTPVPMFDPDVVELNATMLLRFLQENCSREGGTYLLHRSEGAAHVQLYDVSALSRQRNRRWKWLLAMLCYRFALRISHHTRQPWCRGGRAGKDGGERGSSSSSAGKHGPVDVSPQPGPEVVRQLRRRQRHLLENSLQLLEELAELGGGGHETICASVQEHIADTYLGYGGAQGALPGPGGSKNTGDVESSRDRPSGEQGTLAGAGAGAAGDVEPVTGNREGNRRGSWTVDSEGEVWTSSPPPRPPSVTEKGSKKEKRRGDVQGKSGAERKNATHGDEFEGLGKGGGSHPRSVRLGGGGSSRDDVATAGGVGGFASFREREENLDKAQDHLTNGIAILRGVMARQESAAAGGGSGESDVVIVGESKRPVAIMRQKQSPWLAVDDQDDEEEEEEKSDRAAKMGGHDGTQGGGHGGGGGGGLGRRRRRRGSRDESEDPATALSVVSEQLWGLQQKLVGTYMAVARARLRRAFPDPVLVATSSPSEKEGQSGKRTGNRNNDGTRRKNTGKASAAGGAGEYGSRSGRSEDGPDEETRAELVQGALESLCAAWEHLVESKGTLDRRSAMVFADENAEGGGVDGGSDDRSTDGSESAAAEGVSAAHLQDERAEKLGPLWKGSLSEALARSRQGTSNGSGGRDAGDMHKEANNNSAGMSGRVVNANGAATASTRRSLYADDDVWGRLAWTHAARRQLESRRAELFELCGDVAHACVSLRARAMVAGLATPAAGDGRAVASSTCPNTTAQRSLPARLQELLSSTHPPLKLEDLDVCQGVHGRVWDALSGPVEQGVAKSGASSSGKRGRGVNRSRTQAGSSKSGSLPESSDVDEGIKGMVLSASSTGGSAAPKEDPRPLAETCVHSLAKAGRVPGDPMAWSLCLAAEACYERALLDLDRVNPDVSSTDAGAVAETGAIRRRNGDAMFTGVPEAQARIRKKLGDASNELGKLMARCAGALVQAPAPRNSQGARPASNSEPDGSSSAPTALTLQHPGLGWNGGGGTGGDKTGGGKEGGPTLSRGAATAVELCGEAHATLGRREGDERTWDHASGELAMAYLCLGVERRQELLATLLQPDTESAGSRLKDGALAKVSASSLPTIGQVRGVVGPLEQALQIYTDMKNAPQAAACHYQIGQYYLKILPAYVRPPPPTESAGYSSSHDGITGSASNSAATTADTSTAFKDQGSSALQVAKAWEAGQRAARHFLAARAYFAPFEHGPTSVILALDLCNLYLFLAEMGATTTSGGGGGDRATATSNPLPSPRPIAESGDGVQSTVPIPSLPGSVVSGETETAVSGHPTLTTTGGGGGGGGGGGAEHRLRTTAAVRFQCLEGALRSLLDTQSVFAEAGINLTVTAAAAGQPQHRLTRLLESVMERLPKVLQALVRASIALEPSPPSSSAVASSTSGFKSMYKTSLMALRDGEGGAQRVLARLAKEYECYTMAS
eukprot:g8081.t1